MSMRTSPQGIVKHVVDIALGAAAISVHAWPDKTVTIIVPWPPGGPSDIAARPVAQGLTESLFQTRYEPGEA